MIHTTHSAFETAHLERANRRQAHIKRLENGITELSAHIYAATTTDWCTRVVSALQWMLVVRSGLRNRMGRSCLITGQHIPAGM